MRYTRNRCMFTSVVPVTTAPDFVSIPQFVGPLGSPRKSVSEPALNSDKPA